MAELSEKVICGLKIAFVGLTDPSTTTRQDPAEVEGCSEPAE